MKTLVLTAMMLLMCGCIPLKMKGTTHYLVIGIGVVSVNNTNQYAASVSKATVLGGYATEHGGGIGLSSDTLIMVSTNADMTIQVNGVPFKPLNVEVKK